MAGDKFKLGDEVIVRRSGERGMIVGRATYLDSTPSNFIRYTAAGGRYCEAWLVDSELELVKREGVILPHVVAQ